MYNSYFSPQRLSHITSDIKLLKVLVFEIANYFFALPLAVIFKVINCPPITDTTDSNLGIVDFEGQPLTVVNLAEKLYPQNLTTQKLQKRFLILSQTRRGELCGIPINKPPALIELPMDNISPLPSTARQVYPANIATHVAILPKPEGSVQIFLLGMADIASAF